MAKRCLGCMKMKNQSPVCEHCGYNENVPNYPHQLPLGTVLRDQYLVGKVLGQGGFGITYMGWDLNLDVPIAIKEYYPNGFVNRECTRSLSVTSGDENRAQFQHNRERFLREARALAKLRDVPGIVRIHNFFQENDTAYIVMEYVEGIDLHRYLKMSGSAFGAQRTLALLQPIMSALCKVHEAGLIHRDISPDNIMILPDGSAKLLDFGAVREVVDADVEKNLSQSTEAILKHGFAPMEQYQNRGSLGPWTDVYGLCATIYYCVTGRVPPDAPARLLEDKPLNWNTVPGLNRQQIAALERCMAIMPKQRTASIAELYNDLYAPAEPQPIPQNIPNSGFQSRINPQPQPNPQPVPQQSRLQNDFRNAYQYNTASNSVPAGGNSFAEVPSTGYPNHTIPLDPNAASGYTGNGTPNSGFVPPVKPITPISPVTPIPPVTPVPPVDSTPKPRKSKKPLLIAAAAAVVAVIALVIGLSGNSSGSSNAEPKEKLAQASDTLDAVMTAGADYTYNYRDGSLLEMYFDNNDLERCRIYFNKDGDMEYKFVAEYNEFGDILNHWVYDSKENLIRQEAYTYDRKGNKLSYQMTDSSGKLLEEIEYTYEGGNMTSYVVKAGDGTVKQESAYGYENGKQVSAIHIYNDGSFTEISFNENEKSEAQYNYDKDGNLERWYEYEYDADGQRTATTAYNPDGSVDTTGKPVYNPDGKIVKDTWYKSDGSVSYTMSYKYIAKEVQISYTYESTGYKTEYEYVKDLTNTSVLDFGYSSGTYSNGYSICRYDNFGNSLERINYKEDGSLYYTSEYSYDAYGNSEGYTYTFYSDDGSYDVTEYDEDSNARSKTSYDANGNTESWTEYEYDAEDVLQKEITYLADGTLSGLVELTYDADGEIFRRTRTTYNDDGTYYVNVSDGNYNTLTSTTYDASGNVKYLSRYEYEWNANGKPAKAYVYNKDGKLSYWTEYFYDENGNYKDSETHFD